jgi:hypothetical protein
MSLRVYYDLTFEISFDLIVTKIKRFYKKNIIIFYNSY